MDLKWIMVTLLFSVVSLAAYVPHRYHFVSESMSWTEAQSYCRHYYTDLATINNMEEMKKLNATLKDKAGNHVWIGLKRGDGQKWKWSLQDGTIFTVGQSYSHWHAGEPNNVMNSNASVIMYADGTWNDDNLMSVYDFVCLTGQKTPAPRLVLIAEKKSFSDAQIYCRKYYADLPSVRNQTENDEILAVANGNAVWIGLFRDSWEWSDQSTSMYRNWLPWLPDNVENKNCTTVSLTGQLMGSWEEWTCSSTFPFICLEDQLVLVNLSLSWREALRYCRENHVDLVSVHSEEIQLWVMEVAQKASTEYVWLGLRYTCTQGFWYWVSGFSVCYQNWAPGNGTGGEDCRSVERTGAVQSGGEQQWVSLPENQELNFICTNYEA